MSPLGSDESVDRLMRGFVNALQDPGMILTANLRISALNRQAITVLGDRETLLDRSLDSILTGGSENRTLTLAELPEFLDEYDEFTGEMTFKSLDGGVIPVLVSLSRIDRELNRSAFLLTFRELYDYQTCREQLRQSRDNYRELFNNSSEAIFLHDPETAEILDVNRRMCELYGCSYEEALELTVGDLSSGEEPSTVNQARTYVEKARNKGSQKFEWHARRATGELFWVEVQLKEVTIDYDPIIMASVRDITERRQYRKELEESNSTLRQFASLVTHGLKQPLRTITSYIQLLEKNLPDRLREEFSGYVTRITDGTRRMKKLMDHLRRYSEVNFADLDPETVDLNDVLESVRADLETLLTDDDITVTVGRLPTIQGDKPLLEDLFRNLIDNAITHAGTDPVEIRVESEKQENGHRLCVSDDGPGIPESRQVEVFKLFESFDSDPSNSGVGLAICQKIVELHDGDISLESQPGH